MDTTVEVSPTVADLLCNHNRPLSETARLCYKARHGQDESSGDQTLEVVFAESLQLKARLNDLEKSDGRPTGWSLLAAFINCEYQLSRANKVPLRYNPWLSHWVEAVQSLRSNTDSLKPRPGQSTPVPELQRILEIRVEFIKALLSSNSAEIFELSSPVAIFRYLDNNPVKDFEIDRYVRMLEEEGIYEPVPATRTAQGRVKPAKETLQQSKRAHEADFTRELEKNPIDALNRFKTLPVDLQSLELINSLLFSGDLDDYDPPSLMLEYIQHALRHIEHICPEGGSLDGSEAASSMSGRKDDQIRAVKLLILFMRNLLGRNVINPQTSYFEIQEICVRFIWIKEVRDFRVDLEAGAW